MAALPYMRLYVADYLADTGHLTAAQHGAYLMLIMSYWRRGRPLPDDDKFLSSVARMTLKEWRKNRAAIADLFAIHDGEWNHIRVEKELSSSKDTRSSKSRAGVESARKKSNTCATDEPSLFNDIRYQISDSEEEPNGSSPLVPHPTWMPPEPEWSDWIAHRREIKKPTTERIERENIKQLAEWFAEGRDVAAIITYNIRQGWQGMFLPRENINGRNTGSNLQQQQGDGRGERPDPCLDMLRAARAAQNSPDDFGDDLPAWATLPTLGEG